MMTALVTEFIIHPVIHCFSPSVLKRIGLGCVIIVLTHIGYLALSIIVFLKQMDLELLWPNLSFGIIIGVIVQFMIVEVLEYICAQSPYNMRGSLTGYVLFLFLTAISVGAFVSTCLSNSSICKSNYCLIIESCIATVISVVGLILHCCVARWYKMRVREELYSPQRIVEEVYDRYLSNVSSTESS